MCGGLGRVMTPKAQLLLQGDAELLGRRAGDAGGLNVAADPFMNVAVSGTHGGLVIVVADDPSMHSSQNEQDSRYFADFAMVPSAWRTCARRCRPSPSLPA